MRCVARVAPGAPGRLGANRSGIRGRRAGGRRRRSRSGGGGSAWSPHPPSALPPALRSPSPVFTAARRVASMGRRRPGHHARASGRGAARSPALHRGEVPASARGTLRCSVRLGQIVKSAVWFRLGSGGGRAACRGSNPGAATARLLAPSLPPGTAAVRRGLAQGIAPTRRPREGGVDMDRLGVGAGATPGEDEAHRELAGIGGRCREAPLPTPANAPVDPASHLSRAELASHLKLSPRSVDRFISRHRLKSGSGRPVLVRLERYAWCLVGLRRQSTRSMAPAPAVRGDRTPQPPIQPGEELLLVARSDGFEGSEDALRSIAPGCRVRTLDECPAGHWGWSLHRAAKAMVGVHEAMGRGRARPGAAAVRGRLHRLELPSPAPPRGEHRQGARRAGPLALPSPASRRGAESAA